MSANTNEANAWEKVTARRSFWLLPIVAALFIIASFMLVLIPQIQTIRDGRQELQQQKEQLTRLTEKRQFLEGLSTGTLDQQYALASRVLPNEKPVFQTVGLLVGRTQAAKLSLTNYDLNPGELSSGSASAATNEVKAGALTPLPVDFTVGGTFADIYSLLTAFEVTAPLSQISAFELNGFKDKADTAATDQVSAKLGANVYYAPPPHVLGKASDLLKPLTAAQLETLTQIQDYQEATSDAVLVPGGIDEQKANPFTF